MDLYTSRYWSIEELISFIAPADRVDWLKWAFQRGYCEDSYQKFNESKFMTVIDSYRDTAGAIKLINSSIDQYREVYKSMGMDVK